MSLRQLLINVGDSFYYSKLARELSGSKSVLDVGCGSNSPLAKIQKTFYSVGFDIFEPSIQKSKKMKIHDEYKIGNLLKMNKYFKPKSFDTVVALDVIEHFEKNDGWELLKQMEKVAKKKVIIFTPFGFTQQHPYDGNPYQIHKSGWRVNDFSRRGYKAYGFRGLRFIRGEYATIKYKPWILWGALSAISQCITYFIPQISYQLLAVKKIKDV